MVIKAKYPDAPPCPTLEYKKAITIKAKLNNKIFSELSNCIYSLFQVFFVSGFKFNAVCLILHTAFRIQINYLIFLFSLINRQ
jgi:hypothetical protein